jgi:NAD(P)H dehydrogenase (quinone)
VRDAIHDEEDARSYDRGILDCPIVTLDDIARSDAIVFGAPTRYGRLASEMSAFFDKLSTFHAEGCSLKGKIGSAFTEVGGQGHGYGGHEAALVSIHALFLQHGMVTVGVPPLPVLEATPNASVFGTALRSTSKAGTAADLSSISSRVRELNEAEVKIAYAQGEWVSLIAKQLHDDGAVEGA